MKILHIVAGDLSGGAARGAYWLHKGSTSQNIDSKMLIQGAGNSDDIIQIDQSSTFKRLRQKLEQKAVNFLLNRYPNRKAIIFSTGFIGNDITVMSEYEEADIIHLHWINNNMLSIKNISRIKKPIVWTLRDMWPMTGGCHYAMECEHYKTGCGNCEQLQSNSSYDLSKFILNGKKKYLPKNIKIVGISDWLSGEAKKSELFNEFDVRTISNNINTKEFFPTSKETAKEVLGVKTSKRIILVGSTNIKDFYKGFSKYLEALEFLDKDKYFLCFFGSVDKSILDKLEFEYKKFGYLYDNISLRLTYSSADVFVAPSLMEAFGKTIAEAMSCGTPVVCFDATGPKDIVDHKTNGYLATPFDSADLARGIEWVLNTKNYDELCQNAREKVLREFDSAVVAKKYIELYESILDFEP